MKRGTIAVQAVCTAAVLEALAAFGHGWLACIFGTVLFLAAGLMWALNQRYIDPPKLKPANRLFVPFSMAILLLPWLPPPVEFDKPGADDAATVTALLLALASAFAGLYLSSLIDRFYVLPRLRGDRKRPLVCEESLAPRWRRVTRIWLLHRLLATLVFVTGIATVVTLSANRWVQGLDQVVAAAIFAAATILAGFYLTRAASVIAQVLSPAIQIGDKIQLAEEFVGKKPETDYYVVEVALEGYRLLELDGDDIPAAGAGTYRTHDRVLDVPDISKYLRSRRPFAGCAPGECKAVNPYCHRRPGVEQIDP